MARLMRVRGAAAAVTAVGLVLLAAAPGSAATSLADGTASAVVVTVAGSPTDSGTYSVSNDGSTQSSAGTNRPQVTALAGQSLLTAGVLTQDATSSVTDGSGQVAACSGIAGQGASVAAVGQGSCLTGGQTLRLSVATLDLSRLTLVEGTLLHGLDQQLAAALQPVVGQVLPALGQGLRDGLQALGSPGLYVDLGAVQSHCVATPDSASADASLAGAGVYVEMSGQRVDLLALPADPEPNTHVVTGLDKVASMVRATLRPQLTQALQGALGPLAAAVDQAAVIDTVLANLGAELGPLDQNLLSATLNRQSSSGPGDIAVEALDLQVLPAAAELGVEALRVQLGRSSCSAGTAPVVASTPASAPVKKHKGGLPVVPTAVPGGLAEAPAQDGTDWPVVALAGLLLVGALAAGTRRRG